MVCLTTKSTDNAASKSGRKGSSSSIPTISSSDVNVRTLIYMLKYWTLYVMLFGMLSNLTWTLLSVLPFGSLGFLCLNGFVTLELVYQFIEFIESQDGKVFFLFNKFNDSNVTWWQWVNYATTYDENNVASNFVFGKLTQFVISLANRSPFSRTDYLDRGFNIMELYLRQFTHTIIMQREAYGQQQQQRQARQPRDHEQDTSANVGRKSTASRFSEGYDMLDDILQESRQRKN